MKWKLKLSIIILTLLLILGVFLYFRYFFTYEQTNVIKRSFENFTGQNLTVTVFDMNGKIVKRWVNVQKITSGKDVSRSYTFFYTKDGKYVQIPNSVWYIAEEE